MAKEELKDVEVKKPEAPIDPPAQPVAASKNKKKKNKKGKQ